jgi:hypothetical protein
LRLPSLIVLVEAFPQVCADFADAARSEQDVSR